MGIEEVLYGFGQGELDIHHPAIGQHHHKKGEPPHGAIHRDHAEGPPIHLGAFAGHELEFDVGGMFRGVYLTDVILEDGIAALKALGPEFLKHLLGTVGMFAQPCGDLLFERVQFTTRAG